MGNIPAPGHTSVTANERLNASQDQQFEVEAAAALQALKQSDKREYRGRIAAAGVMLGVSAVVGWALSNDTVSDLRSGTAMPFRETAQKVVNNSDHILADVGKVSFIAAATGVGLLKLGAARSPRLQVVDQWSSREMSETRLSKRSAPKRVLEAGFAGRVPAMVALSAGLAGLSAGIGAAVSEGPQAPIERAMNTLTVGDTMIVEHQDVMPMVESDISRQLATRIITKANEQGVTAQIFDQKLGVARHGDKSYADLVIGSRVPASSPIAWSPEMGCESIPVAIDGKYNIGLNERILLDGTSAKVVELPNDISSSNRLGVLVDSEALANCIKGNGEAPVHSLVVNGSPEKVAEIAASVAKPGEKYAVITKNRYLDSSKDFWTKNVKPLISIIFVGSILNAVVSSGSRLRQSLIKGRREWSAKLANANSQAILRATEVARTAKDGLLATVLGGAGAMASPYFVNSLVSGLKVTVGLRELAVTAAVGITASLAGAVRSLINPKKLIRPEESLRS